MTGLGHALLRRPDQVPQSQNIQHLEITLAASTAWGAASTKGQLRRRTYQKIVRTTSIRQAQDVRRKFQQQNQDAHTSNLIILSGWVAAHYWSTVSYLPKTAITLLSQTENVSAPKIRPLEGNQFGGGGSLSALNNCTKTGTGNYVPQGQDFHPIWCIQSTVLYDLIATVYKEIFKIGKITFCIPLTIVSEPMATNREIDDLV